MNSIIGRYQIKHKTAISWSYSIIIVLEIRGDNCLESGSNFRELLSAGGEEGIMAGLPFWNNGTLLIMVTNGDRLPKNLQLSSDNHLDFFFRKDN